MEIDNNTSERALLTVALSRKNWLFAGSDDDRDRTAAIYSLIGTAKLNGPGGIFNTSFNASPITLSTGSKSCYLGTSWRKSHHFEWPPEEFVSMDKKLPHTPEMKAFQAYLDGKTSPKKKMEIRAQVTTAWLIERVRQQSRLRK